MELTTEVPAARPLADVSADRALVAKLRTRNGSRRLCECRILVAHEGVRGDLGDGRERANAKPSARLPGDSAKFGELRDTDHRGGVEHLVTEAADEIRAAGVNLGPLGGELLHGGVEGGRPKICE
jgi:hypothetical protein